MYDFIKRTPEMVLAGMATYGFSKKDKILELHYLLRYYEVIVEEIEKDPKTKIGKAISKEEAEQLAGSCYDKIMELTNGKQYMDFIDKEELNPFI